MSRLLDEKSAFNESQNDECLRPRTLDEYVGQEELKRNLKVFIGAALNRDETLDHVLLYGPPGLGKTTLAFIIANEMHTKAHIASGPAIEKIGDIASLLSELEPGDILFIDEIHRMPKVVEETLYTAMEDFKFSIVINRETSSKTITIDLPPFTLIGATTKTGSLSSPLRARFGITEKLDYYSVNECKTIIQRTAKVFNSKIEDNAALEIAKCSRGTPRIANRLFKRVRDFANFEGRDIFTIEDAKNALKAMKIDSLGLDEIDNKYLVALIDRFNGGPVGLETLANAIGEEKENLEDVYEPYLIKLGLVDRTLRGRVATKKAFEHIKSMK